MVLYGDRRTGGIWHPVSKRVARFALLVAAGVFLANGVQASPESGADLHCKAQPGSSVEEPQLMLAQASTTQTPATGRSAAKTKGATAASATGAAAKDKSKGAAATKSKTASNGLPKIIEVSAVWCVPCKKFAPIFEKVKGAYTGKADFQSLDFDSPAAKSIIDKYAVTSVPTIVMVNATGKATKFEDSTILAEPAFTAEVKKLVGK